MFGQENEIQEAANEAVETNKAVMRAMDDEFFALQAQSYRKLCNACLEQEFTQTEAIQLTIASMRAK